MGDFNLKGALAPHVQLAASSYPDGQPAIFSSRHRLRAVPVRPAQPALFIPAKHGLRRCLVDEKFWYKGHIKYLTRYRERF